MKESLKAIIFDMDGVLIDSEILYINNVKKFLQEKLQWTVDNETLNAFIGATSEMIWELVKENCPKDWNFDIYKENYRQFCATEKLDIAKSIFEDTLSTLENLTNLGYRLALATSTNSYKAFPIIEECHISPYMEVVLTGNMFKKTKPDPEIYLTCLEKLKLSPTECLVIEDSTYGIEAAKRAGIPVVAKRSTRYFIDQSKADFYINNLRDIIPLINKKSSI